MIRGRVDAEPAELVLTADGFGLLKLARLLRSAADINLPLDSDSGQTSGKSLRELRIAIDESEMVTITISDMNASFVGGPAALTRLAEEILEFGVLNDLDTPGEHTHFDDAEVDSVIAPGSIPLYLAGPLGD